MQLDIMFIISLTDARYDCILMNHFIIIEKYFRNH